jgi:ABC-type multidrug transport system ATPase subunit
MNATKTKYLLFTGIPGSGKSTTIQALIKEMHSKGKTAIFRDKAVEEYRERYSRAHLFISVFKHLSPWFLLKVIYLIPILHCYKSFR